MIKKNHTLATVLFSFFLIWILNAPVFAERNYLFQWDEGEGTTMPGWTWWSDPGPDGGTHPGWRKDDGQLYLGSPTDWRTRSMGINTYGSSSTAEIDLSDRAPSTSSGGSLHIYDDTNFEITGYRSGWWLWYGGENLGEYGYTDSTTNRMSAYVKMEGTSHGTVPEISNTLHIGTYMCWDSYCPQEGPGNLHYYHYYAIQPGAWVHILVDPQPTHRRGTYPTLENIPYDPQWEASGHHYFEYMVAFYYQLAADNGAETDIRFDEIEFYTEAQDENRTSISSIHVGYWPNEDWWEIGWQDISFYDALGASTGSTFDVRWSTSPITNENFESANRIVPIYHNAGNDLVWRADPWWARAWTRFKLDDGVEAANNHLYFAVKDVSVSGGHTGPYPHGSGDGHDAPSSLIKTIDYYLSPDASPTHDSPTITGPSDFSTTSSSVEIEGTYTIDSELAVDTVTWTLGESSGFCVAALGVFSCTVPVELGANSIVFTVTDSNSGTDSDTTVVTRTAVPQASITSTAVMHGVLRH